MAEIYLPAGVEKRVLYPGKGDIPMFIAGTKAIFHFRTFLDNEDRTEIDDSKRLGEPFTLIFGKKFKLEVWENMIETMRVDEIASFHCKYYHVKAYPVVAQSLRDLKKKREGRSDEVEGHRHTCAFDALHRGVGYKDLDNILHNDIDVIFEISLLSVQPPGSYEEETWTLSMEEKLKRVPEWREKGNLLFKQGQHSKAAEIYAQALGCLEQLCLREKPGDTEWVKLDRMKIPFLLNYAQCKLLDEEYYQVITHTTTALEKDPNNVKALYRRGKAHAAVWNPDEAVVDFKRAAELDPSLKKCVNKELKKLEEETYRKLENDKAKYRHSFPQYRNNTSI